jgi:hypothetical protein
VEGDKGSGAKSEPTQTKGTLIPDGSVIPEMRSVIPDMKTTSPITAPKRGVRPAWEEGTYLTDGARLLRVVRLNADGAEVEDAWTGQLEWHPVRELATATRAVTPSPA